MFQFTSGSILGRYELLVPIAHGGMAEVWAARLHGTRGFTKLVAIKTIRAGLIEDTRLEQMLMAEAQLASRIDHPNVVSTLELGEQGETLFLVMEWADSEPLSLLVKETAEADGIPLTIGVNIIAQACKGAHCAHELRDDNGEYLGVVHRDISPQNVLVTYQGMVKLVDFGIAKATQRASSMTEDGEVKGKLAYMSPEQVRGEAVDRRTDIFALGTMLYMVTTGQHPFKGTHPGETIATLFSDAPILPPSRLRADYPKALERVVLKSLSKSRDERYSTAHEMLVALEAAVPEARGIETEVAEFLAKISAGRGEQRRRHIRTAGELLDQRSEGGLSQIGQSSTSLSAMAVGSTGTHTALPGPVARDSEPDFRQSTPKRWIWTGVAASVAVLGGVLTVNWGKEPAPSPDGVQRGEEAVTLAAQAPPAPPAPLPLAATADPAEQDAGSQGRSAAGARKKSLSQAIQHAGKSRKAAAQAPARATPTKPNPSEELKAPEGLTSAVGADTPPPPVSDGARAKPVARKKNDSWDPDTFGGRL